VDRDTHEIAQGIQPGGLKEEGIIEITHMENSEEKSHLLSMEKARTIG